MRFTIWERIMKVEAPFFLIAGPCVIESEALCMQIAQELVNLTQKYGIPYIFKASYRKDNRSRADSFTGIGDKEGLAVLQRVKERFHVRILTDIHHPEDASLAASYGVDILQIPAFMCRQTSLLEAAAKTGKIVNVKKGQFLAPGQMQFVVDKLRHFGCDPAHMMLTERGTQFGYSDLIFDVRGIPEMKALGVPVVMDVTHSLQQPNQEKGVTGGKPALISTLATAAVSLGVDGLFIETHPHPAQALSDGANMLPLDQMETLIQKLLPFREAYLSTNK